MRFRGSTSFGSRCRCNKGLRPGPRPSDQPPTWTAVRRNGMECGEIYSTVTVMRSDITGGLWGMCDQSPSTSCSVCRPLGRVMEASV